MSSVLRGIIARSKAGAHAGIYAVCSANALVLRAAARRARDAGGPLLVEATSNQVNQDGGYTGHTPATFRDEVLGLANAQGLERAAVVLGGDHLGPHPWRREGAEAAMLKAERLVAAFVAAGYEKIHLDCSMPCAGDPETLSDEIVAARATRLMAAAEAASIGGGSAPVYVIGTEVPPPGGGARAHGVIVTSRAAARRTIEAHRRAFADAGLGAVWPRVIALVAQPGVEFFATSVHDYAGRAALDLVGSLDDEPDMVFEVHSTDFQTAPALTALVGDGFAILKVGPALTFALRAALEAVDDIAAPCPDDGRGPDAGFGGALDRAMCRDPRHWEDHYAGTQAEQAFLRRHSFLDRSRYYLGDLEVQEAVAALGAKFADARFLPGIAGALPRAFSACRSGQIGFDLESFLIYEIDRALADYAAACRTEMRETDPEPGAQGKT